MNIEFDPLVDAKKQRTLISIDPGISNFCFVKGHCSWGFKNLNIHRSSNKYSKNA